MYQSHIVQCTILYQIQCTSASVDPHLCRHRESLGHSELISFNRKYLIVSQILIQIISVHEKSPKINHYDVADIVRGVGLGKGGVGVVECWRRNAELTHCPLGDPILHYQFPNSYPGYIFWALTSGNSTKPYWWVVNIDSGNGLSPSGNKALTEPMLTMFFHSMWRH